MKNLGKLQNKFWFLLLQKRVLLVTGFQFTTTVMFQHKEAEVR